MLVLDHTHLGLEDVTMKFVIKSEVIIPAVEAALAFDEAIAPLEKVEKDNDIELIVNLNTFANNTIVRGEAFELDFKGMIEDGYKIIRPMIRINEGISKEMMIDTLVHELIHVYQFCSGMSDMPQVVKGLDEHTTFDGVLYPLKDFTHQNEYPHEVHARNTTYEILRKYGYHKDIPTFEEYDKKYF